MHEEISERVCPRCRNTVPLEVRVCRHCGCALTSSARLGRAFRHIMMVVLTMVAAFLLPFFYDSWRSDVKRGLAAQAAIEDAGAALAKARKSCATDACLDKLRPVEGMLTATAKKMVAGDYEGSHMAARAALAAIESAAATKAPRAVPAPAAAQAAAQVHAPATPRPHAAAAAPAPAVASSAELEARPAAVPPAPLAGRRRFYGIVYDIATKRAIAGAEMTFVAHLQAGVRMDPEMVDGNRVHSFSTGSDGRYMADLPDGADDIRLSVKAPGYGGQIEDYAEPLRRLPEQRRRSRLSERDDYREPVRVLFTASQNLVPLDVVLIPDSWLPSRQVSR